MAVHFPKTAAFLNRLWTEGARGLAELEVALLEALKHDGARLLEKALNDPDLRLVTAQPKLGEANHGRRRKTVLTLLGPLELQRSYFYDAAHQQGRFPLDTALGLVDGYSPTVARWLCRAGARAGSYQAASQDLLTYAGLVVDARQIQRMVEQIGPQMAQWRNRQTDVANPLAGEVFCVSADGTGIPMRRKELKGRKGKQADGTARTREAKVAAIYTHRRPNKKGDRPLRDYNATTYLAEITSAEAFGSRVRAEALRRGMARAKVVVFLGDGAVWVWKLAQINFPDAICILDYYHAAQHVMALANALYGEGTPLAKQRFRQWRKALLKDKLVTVIQQAKRDLPLRELDRKLAKKELAYLHRNRLRMQYQTYRQAGYFIGSGVVEAACKTVVGQRLKQSGMFWGAKGAGHLLTVRCALLSGWFDTFWNQQNTSANTITFAA